MKELEQDYIDYCITLAHNLITFGQDVIEDLKSNDVSKMIKATNAIDSINIFAGAFTKIRIKYIKQGVGIGLKQITLPDDPEANPDDIFDNHFIFKTQNYFND